VRAERSLDAWLDYLLTLHPRNIELGLERVALVAERMALLAPAPTVVTVAGTNGKGTTTTLVEALALQAGKRVGVYTSPHLLRYNERIRINGLPADDPQIVAAFEAIEAARDAVPLTFFEFGTLAALQVFASQPLDIIVLEVGLGGRLDATNIIDPDIAVITSIALDHQEWLGDNREAIGAEKAGILRAGVLAIIADRDPPDSVLRRASELQCQVERWSDGFQSPLQNGLRPENIFAALAVARQLGIHPGDAAAEVLSRVSVPGRLQRTSFQGRPVVLDVAHNPAAVEHLVHWLREQACIPAIAIFAALSDKDVHAMIRACEGVFQRWWVPALPGVARATPAQTLARQMMDSGAQNVTSCQSVADAWERLQDSAETGLVVVFGSFHTVSAFMALQELTP